MASTRPRPKRQAYEEVYVHGNTVLKPEPQQTPSKHREKQERQKKHRESKEVLRRRRNQEKALSMNLPYVAALVAASCCALYICVNYIRLQSGMTARMDTIKDLEQQLNTLKTENDTLETRINIYVDLDYVYKVATEELGMVYANKDQVLMYDKTESEYVRQDEDIPTN